MTLTPRNTRTFYRRLFAGETESVHILKRNDDQQEGTVTSLLVFNAYRGPITKTGEPIQGDETSNRSVTWHFPLVELLRVGINYINALDRIVDRQGRYWQPESGTTITQNLWGNHVCVNCLSVNPTNSPQPQGTEG